MMTVQTNKSTYYKSICPLQKKNETFSSSGILLGGMKTKANENIKKPITNDSYKMILKRKVENITLPPLSPLQRKKKTMINILFIFSK